MHNANPTHRLVTLAAIVASLFLSAACLAGQADRVVIVVWDGLRPDCVNQKDTPTLWKLASEGARFANHHSVYPTSTEVNGAAIATGCYPRHSGIVANREYRPEIELFQAVGTESQYGAWKGDRLSNGLYVKSPTLPEIVRKAGRTTAVAGTKSVAMLLDRAYRDEAASRLGKIVFESESRPASLMDEIVAKFGPIPPVADTKRRANGAQNDWTRQALLECLWGKEVPALSVLWLSEPDYSQHGAGPGTKVAKAALRNCDENLRLVLEALDKAGVRGKTDVLVVSDHGFSTIAYNLDVVDDLKGAGFKAATSFANEPNRGDILVVGNGGTVCFYVVGHKQGVVQELVEHLQTTEYAGVIFTRKAVDGTFTLKQGGIDTKDAPDVVMSMRWWDDTSGTGLAGLLASDGASRGHNQGMHGSLSRYDLHATLIASGPDFRRGHVNKLPSGNADVTPTVLWILGIKPQPAPDGRVLGEVLVNGPAVEGEAKTETLRASNTLGELKWDQYLTLTRLGRCTYYDEGNGKVTVAE